MCTVYVDVYPTTHTYACMHMTVYADMRVIMVHARVRALTHFCTYMEQTWKSC